MPTACLPPVLVVDDDRDHLLLIKRLLAKAGVKNPVVTFEEAAKATTFLKAACSSPDSGLIPCVLFTDHKMPAMDGFELIKWIREQKAFARLPVVMLSSSKLDKDMKRAKALGVDHYLIKFPNPDVISKIVIGSGPKRK